MSKVYITLRCEKAMKEQVAEIAKKERRTVSQVALILLEQALQSRKQKAAA